MAITGASLVAKVSVEGDAEAKAKLQSVNEKTKETSGGFKEMLSRGFEFATGMAIFDVAAKAVDFLKEQVLDVVKVTMAHQQVEAQLNQVLLSTHDISGMTAQSLNELADSFSKTTRSSADTVLGGENLLLTFTNIGKSVFPQATQSILDVSTAMHQDLKSSAVEVGKALGDPLKGMSALQRIGVTFSESQKEAVKQMMATGNVAGAQKVILKELATEFGHSAQAAGQTFPGQLKILQDHFEELKIKIGEKVMPVLTNLLGWFSTTALPALGQFGDFLGTHLGPAFQAIGGWIQSTVIPALQRFGSWIQTVGIPALQQFGGWIQTSVIPALQAVGNFFMTYILPILQRIGTFLVSTFAPVWQQLVQVWNSQILPALKQLWSALQPLMPVFAAIGGIILGLLTVAFGIFVGLIGGLLKALAGFLSGVATIIGGVVQFITGVVQVISGIVTFITDLLTGHFDKLGGDLKRIWDGIVNMFTGVWNVIKGIFLAAWGAISGFVSGLVSGVIGFFQHLADMLVGHSIIPDMIGAIVGWFLSLPGKALNAIGGLLGNLVNFFGGLARQAVQWGLNIIANLAGGIINGIWSSLGNAMSAIGTFIHDHLPASPAKIGPLRDLAKQGAFIPEQIAQGIMSGIPKLQPSLNLMLATRMSGIPAGFGGAGISGLSPSSGTQQPIILEISGYQFARLMLPHIVTAIRTNVGITNI